MKQIIAVDIDDVLAENAAGFVGYSNSKWGTDLSVHDYDEDWSKMWSLSQEETELRAEVLLRDAPKTYDSVEGALSALLRLSRDYSLIAVTSRRSWVREDTKVWLDTHYPGIFNDKTLHFSGIWDQGVGVDRVNQSKAEIIKRLAVDFLIDDQLKHCVAVASQGKRALLFGNYSWNQAADLPQRVTRVADWSSVEKYFYDQL